jgi:hypothetical protein
LGAVSTVSADADDVPRDLAALIEVCVESRFADLMDIPPDVRS